MNGIVVSRHGRQTANTIAGLMKEPVKVNGKDLDVLIRWGCRTPYKASRYVNLSKNLKNVSDKVATRGILTVPMTRTYEGGEFSTIIGRPRHHRAGKDFYICTNQKEYEEAKKKCDYFTHFYPKTREFRVHVAHGKVLALLEKAPCEGIAWNHALNQQAWTVLRWNEYDIEICKLALQACDDLELDFCAVDILAFPTDDQPRQVVCEVNSAPSLEGYTAERYAKYFDWLIRSERKHYNWKKYTEPKSFAFKNKQLAK